MDGLAKIEGEVIEEDDDASDNTATADHSKKLDSSNIEEEKSSTVYRLMGIVVHSGQASGGHYYSYIIPRFV